MLTNAPWLTANNPLQFMERGAQLGVAARGQDLSQMEAGQRLRLSYDQLAASQDEARRRLAAQSAQTSAAQALKGSYESALMGYQERALAEKQAQLEATTTAKESAAAALKTHQDNEDKLTQQLRDIEKANSQAKKDAEDAKKKAEEDKDTEEVETTKEVTPGKPAVDEVKAQPESGHLWWKTPAVPGHPAIPAIPASTVTTRRVIHPGAALNAAVQPQQNPLTAGSLAGPPPPGTSGNIPKAKWVFDQATGLLAPAQ